LTGLDQIKRGLSKTARTQLNDALIESWRSNAQETRSKNSNPKDVQRYDVDRLFFPNMSEARIHKIEGIQIHKNSLITTLSPTLSPRRLKKNLILVDDTRTGVHGKK